MLSYLPMEVARTTLSWSEWFNRFGPRMLLFARQQTRSEADAEDVLQNAIVRLWKTNDPEVLLQPGRVFAAIRYAAIDLARSNSRRQAREDKVTQWTQGEETQAPGAVAFERTLEADEKRQAIQEALNQLTPEQQEVVVLHIWGELTFEETAHVLGIPQNTAASRYRYALQALRRKMKPVEDVL